MLDDLHCSHVERWVEGFEGKYSVRVDGEVVSYTRKTPKILAGGFGMNWKRNQMTYKKVCLIGGVLKRNGGSGSKQKSLSVHRCVAIAFLVNKEGKPEVNHKDGDKTNNSVHNLEWVTNKENVSHAYEIGLQKRGEREPTVQKRDDKVERLLSGDPVLDGVVAQARKFISDEELVEKNIPAEVLGLVSPRGCAYDPLSIWNGYIDLFRLCDNPELTLKDIAGVTGYDQSTISKFRSGSRGVNARGVYNKYKNDPYFFERYSPVYNHIFL